MISSRPLLLRTILLWSALELLAAWQVRADDGSRVLISWFRTAAHPVSAAGNGLVNLVSAFGLGMQDLEKTISDNQRMRLELEELHARDVLVEEDLRALRDATLLAGPSAEYAAGAVVARCTFRDLAAGTMEVRTAELVTVAKDSPALTRDGLVGRVIRSDGRRHWLQLLTHSAAAVAVRTDDGGVEGLALGSGSDTMAVAYIPRQATLERGTVLITSGADGIFPPGIPTAWIIRVRETEDPFLEVVAAASANLRTTRVVLLLPEWSGNTPRGIR